MFIRGEFLPDYSEGNIISDKLLLIGNSYYLIITRDILKYLQLDPEKDSIIIKFEKGKWGPYIGIGKKKI